MFDSQEKLFKTSECDNCYYYEKHNLGMDGTVDICYAQNRKEFLGGVILNKNYKNNIKCDKYKSCKQHYKEINKKLKIYEELEQQLGCDLEVVFKALMNGIVDKKSTYTPIDINLGVQLYNGNPTYVIRYIDYEEAETIRSLGFNYFPKYWLLKDYQKTWWLASDKKEKPNDN